MTQELSARGGSNFPKRKLLLLGLIICLGWVISTALAFLHQIVESSFGSGLADVVVAGGTIEILFMILVGMLFLHLARVIKQNGKKPMLNLQKLK